MTNTPSINGFSGNFRFLSNFVPAWIVFEDELYPSVEHAYQAAKTLNLTIRANIRGEKSPGKVKRMGAIDRDDWHEIKDDIMLDLLIQKFAQEPYRQLLIDTDGFYLEETNTWNDVYWGVCNGQGLNKLGHMLMEIRSHLLEI